MEEFTRFPKIPRLFRDCVITEKIDGTNAQVMVADDGTVTAGSRTRWLTTKKGEDNFGFAVWVEEHATELRELGVGRHYGEWWGQGIQRAYGLDHKRFSLFNTGRWVRHDDEGDEPPACCDVVPILYAGEFSTSVTRHIVGRLRLVGYVAEPGYMNPEGIVIFHTAASQMFKVTLEGDEKPKTLANVVEFPGPRGAEVGTPHAVAA